jgi:hypothetical protein
MLERSFRIARLVCFATKSICHQQGKLNAAFWNESLVAENLLNLGRAAVHILDVDRILIGHWHPCRYRDALCDTLRPIQEGKVDMSGHRLGQLIGS